MPVTTGTSLNKYVSNVRTNFHTYSAIKLPTQGRDFILDKLQLFFGPTKDGEAAQAGLAGAGYPVFDSMIRRSVAFTKAAVSGVTVRGLPDPRLAAAWEDYESLGNEIRGMLQ
jgi:hypothetical protein